MPDFIQNPAFVFYFETLFKRWFMLANYHSNSIKVCINVLLLGIFLACVGAGESNESLKDLAKRTQFRLNALHHPDKEGQKLKQCELLLSEEGFLRYRRTHTNGKQEYFSFNLSRIKSINYLGDTQSGELAIETLEDDVIVQTFNDRGGNVDSMSTHFILPLNKIEAEDLISLQADLLEMKEKLY